VVQVHLGTACLMAAFICRMLTCTLALVQVVAILDADFIPGPRTFVDGLRIPAVYDHLTTLLRDKRAVVVIPAFEHRVGYHWWHDVDNNSGIDEEVLKRANQLVSELVDGKHLPLGHVLCVCVCVCTCVCVCAHALVCCE
jgi:hypothetical protein